MDLRGGVKVRLEILRRVNAQSEPYLQVIEYTPKSKNDTVAFALSEINKGGYRDESGAEVLFYGGQAPRTRKSFAA